MSPEWMPLLIQAPIVGIFALFVYYQQKEWQKSIDKLSSVIGNLAEKVNELNGAERVARSIADTMRAKSP